MNEYIYKVSSLETAEGPRGSRIARLQAASPSKGDRTFPKEICLSLDDVAQGDFVRLTVTKLTAQEAMTLTGSDHTTSDTARASTISGLSAVGRVHFLHHHDRKNQGDILSGPYQYFDFGNYSKISWDQDILKGGKTSFANGDSIIMGGGIYFTRDKPRLARLIERSRHFIGWGIGLDARLNNDEFINKYTLLGTRERNSNFIDDKRVFYVPCASCMNEVFVRPAASSDIGIKGDRIALHTNGGFNQKIILKRFGHMEKTTTVDTFADIIANLESADCVLTNSYHGAYWGSLLGKKVVCFKTEVPKWDGLHKNIVFSELDDVEDAIKAAVPIPADYLQECRDLNSSFFVKVAELLRS